MKVQKLRLPVVKGLSDEEHIKHAIKATRRLLYQANPDTVIVGYFYRRSVMVLVDPHSDPEALLKEYREVQSQATRRRFGKKAIAGPAVTYRPQSQ